MTDIGGISGVWSPSQPVIAGWKLEVPARAPGLAANLWVHFAGNTSDSAGFPPVLSDAEWHRGPLYAYVPVAPNDTVLAGLASVAIAGAKREETGLFNSDDWGLAVESLAPLQTPIVGPTTAVFVGQMATLGNCWPVGLWLVADLLVLRSSIVPAVPPVHGTYPKVPGYMRPFGSLRDLAGQLVHLANQQSDVLRKLVTEIEAGVRIEEGARSGATQLPSVSNTSAPVAQPTTVRLSLGPRLSQRAASSAGTPSEEGGRQRTDRTTPRRENRPSRRTSKG